MPGKFRVLAQAPVQSSTFSIYGNAGSRVCEALSSVILYRLKLNSVALVCERTIPTERPPLLAKLMPTFADRGCRMVSATDSHGR
jgi:hypothetical protein